MNLNDIIIYDYETTGKDPNTCELVQIGALALNSKTLEIENKFCSYCCPPDEFWEQLENDEEIQKTVKWHADNYKVSSEEILRRWKEAPPTSVVWGLFLDFISKYRRTNTIHGMPIRAGHNILKYDDIITKRMMDRYAPKEKYPFHHTDFYDTLHLHYILFAREKEPRKNNMNDLRDFYGLKHEQDHDALQDCYDCAKMLTRWLRFLRKVVEKKREEIKGCLADAQL